jgi:ABC-type lipoprotein release transport system permease subunit
MIFYAIGLVLAIAGLIFGDITSLVIALLVTSLAMLDEKDRR